MKKIIAIVAMALVAGAASADLLASLTINTVTATTNNINAASGTWANPANHTVAIQGGFAENSALGTIGTYRVVDGGATGVDYIGASTAGTAAVGEKSVIASMFNFASASTVTNLQVDMAMEGTQGNYAWEYRAIIQQGSSYYISEVLRTSQVTGGTNMSGTALLAKSWFNYDTANMMVVGSSATLANLNNISAAGGIAFTTVNSGTVIGAARLRGLEVQGVIPEPATVGMLGLGALVTLVIRRMKR